MPSPSQAASAGLAVGAVAVVVAFGVWTASHVSLVPAPSGLPSSQLIGSSGAGAADTLRAVLSDAVRSDAATSIPVTSQTSSHATADTDSVSTSTGTRSEATSTTTYSGADTTSSVPASSTSNAGVPLLVVTPPVSVAPPVDPPTDPPVDPSPTPTDGSVTEGVAGNG